eukprot:8337338-Alexandrium_andersonii.AAC.1
MQSWQPKKPGENWWLNSAITPWQASARSCLQKGVKPEYRRSMVLPVAQAQWAGPSGRSTRG